MTYEEVFAEVLALRGEDALASADVLVGCAMDVSGAEWRRENRVLSRVLDDEALGPFSRAETPSELAAARASLRSQLIKEEFLSEEAAEALCGGLAGGIAAWRGFGEAPGGEEPDGTAPRAYPDGGAPDGERGGARLDLTLADVDPIPPQAYTGGPITPEPSVRLGGRTLENGRDYRLIYYTNVGSATATSEAQVVVRGIWSGGYTGAKAVRFKIAPQQAGGGPDGTVRRTTPDAGAQRVLPDGSVYEGGWEDGAPSGSGKMWYPDGNTYDGEWRDGKRSGRGRMTWTSGSVYDGEWRDGVRSGRGRCTWSDGSVYEGEWRDDAPSGRGKGTWANGETYDGEWRDGVRSGHGRMIWSDGRVYDGEWRRDQRSGFGRMECPEGSSDNSSCAGQWASYAGQWERDTFVGGTVVLRDGRVYVGSAREGVITGEGKMTWPNGSVYVGEWRRGRRSGRGRMAWPDGSTYKGEWWDDAPSDHSKLTQQDGHTYEGEWRDGKLDLALADVDPIPPQAYTGEPITPEPVVRLNGRTLEKGRDYTLAYYANVGSPTATSEARVVVRHTASGKYTGAKMVSFKLVPQQADTAKRSDDDNADHKTCSYGCLWLSLSALFWIIMIGEASRGNEGVANGIFVVWIAVTIVFTLFNQPHSEK